MTMGFDDYVERRAAVDLVFVFVGIAQRVFW